MWSAQRKGDRGKREEMRNEMHMEVSKREHSYHSYINSIKDAVKQDTVFRQRVRRREIKEVRCYFFRHLQESIGLIS